MLWFLEAQISLATKYNLYLIKNKFVQDIVAKKLFIWMNPWQKNILYIFWL